MGWGVSCPGQFILTPTHLSIKVNLFLLSFLILNYLNVMMYQFKHKTIQIYLFSLSDCSVCLVAGVRGKLSWPVYLAPHPPGYQSKIVFAKFSHFKLSECDDVSIINIIQVKFSCFLYLIVLYA